MNQIHAAVITASDTVRHTYRRLSGLKLVSRLARSRPAPGQDQVAQHVLRRLARRHVMLTEEITTIDTELEHLVQEVNPGLLAINGVGKVTAATLLVAVGDNPERMVNKAAFAALCGVAPIPASSGKRTRYRLSRGGNRQANSALHRIVLSRMRHDESRTVTYFTKRRGQQLTDRDIIRCLKRHVANEMYRAITQPTDVAAPGRQLRTQRQAAGVTVTTLAAKLNVPYQRLRRLEIGTRTDPDLVHAATTELDRVTAEDSA